MFAVTLYILYFSAIGLPISLKKIQWPSKKATGLGFDFNLETQKLAVKAKTVTKYTKLVDDFIEKPYNATIKRMEQLTGRLRYASRAIHGSLCICT